MVNKVPSETGIWNKIYSPGSEKQTTKTQAWKHTDLKTTSKCTVKTGFVKKKEKKKRKRCKTLDLINGGKDIQST